MDIDYEIEILTANIELYEQLRQAFIAEKKTLPVEGRTRRFEGLERISGLKTIARQRLAELNFTKLTQSSYVPRTCLQTLVRDFDKQGRDSMKGICPCEGSQLWFNVMDEERAVGRSKFYESRLNNQPACFNTVCSKCKCEVEANRIITGQYRLVRLGAK